jgi:hypothetical protein
MGVAAQVRHTFSRRIWAIVVLTCAALLPVAACSGESASPTHSSPATMSSVAPPTNEPSTAAPPPGPPDSSPAPTSAFTVAPSTVAPTPVPDSRRQTEQSELVTANAYWRKPDALKVDQPTEIGLGIQTAPLTTQINAWMEELPGTNQPAGQIQVSPQATASLVASSADAEVTPSGSQNTSWDEHIQMAWKWTITPKRPTEDLILTAYLVVHIDGGPDAVITTPVTLHIPVQRTASYTLERIFTNWGTWSAIVVALAGGATWIRKKVRRPTQPSAA